MATAMPRRDRSGRLAAALAAVLALAGCNGDEIKAPARQVVSAAPMPAAAYAGEITFGFSETLPTPSGALPVKLYLGLTGESPTRLGLRAAVDLRDVQRELPLLVSGRQDPDCGLGLEVALAEALAEGDAVRARGTVRADLYRCKARDTAAEARGAHLWSQLIGFDALVGAGLQGECARFELRELALDPRGFFGGLGTAFGVTEKVRRAILEQGNAALRDAPVCPDMPEALSLLAPDFTSAGPMEIGDGGLGAALSGAVATDAARLLGLLSLWQGKGLLPPAAEGAAKGDVSVLIENSLPKLEPETSYRIELAMTAVSPTRIGIAATLDLRELQQRLPGLAAGALLVDDCRARVELGALTTEAAGQNVIARARLDARSYACDRKGDSDWSRGALESSETVDVRAEVSAGLENGCVVFQLVDLARDPPLPAVAEGRLGARTAAARTLFIDAVDHLLKDRPLCPELPPVIAALDPRFTQGAPTEIGQGGLALALDGSIDLSTGAMLSVMTLLQARGDLPPAP